MNALENWNRLAFLSWNAGIATPVWQLKLAGAAADYLVYLVPIALTLMWCWGGKARRENALKICVLAALALGINQLIAMVYPHPRPFAIGLGHTFIQHAADSSFPSDHATVMAAMAIGLLSANARSLTGWLMLAAGACVAWARIYLGVHYPLDMVGAVGVVAATSLALSPLWRAHGPGWTARAEKLYHLVLAWPIALGWIRR
jgi:undecaprenyl-diphosphatase